jgi:hypothetical protein
LCGRCWRVCVGEDFVVAVVVAYVEGVVDDEDVVNVHYAAAGSTDDEVDMVVVVLEMLAD